MTQPTIPVDADCGCTALLSCFKHYQRERGTPAIRRVTTE